MGYPSIYPTGVTIYNKALWPARSALPFDRKRKLPRAPARDAVNQ